MKRNLIVVALGTERQPGIHKGTHPYIKATTARPENLLEDTAMI